jgi:hypothetical protein
MRFLLAHFLNNNYSSELNSNQYCIIQSNAKKSRQEVFGCLVQSSVFPFWLIADYDCILDCLAECKNSVVLEKPHL